MIRSLVACCCLAACAVAALAQESAVVLRANTLIPLRLLETIGSDTHVGGAKFALVVTDDIHVDDTLVIPAGSQVEGEIIHAAKSGMFGKAGELSITSRFLMVGERRIRLRSLYAKAGETRADLAMGVGLVIPLAPFFIRGKQVIVPAETELIARIAVDEVFTLIQQPGDHDEIDEVAGIVRPADGIRFGARRGTGGCAGG